MQRQWIQWVINLCLIGTLVVAVVTITMQGLLPWWLQIGNVSIAVIAIWLKFFFPEFSKQPRLSHYAGIAFALLVLLHFASWFLGTGGQSDTGGLIVMLSQDLLIAAAVVAFYFQRQKRVELEKER